MESIYNYFHDHVNLFLVPWRHWFHYFIIQLRPSIHPSVHSFRIIFIYSLQIDNRQESTSIKHVTPKSTFRHYSYSVLGTYMHPCENETTPSWSYQLEMICLRILDQPYFPCITWYWFLCIRQIFQVRIPWYPPNMENTCSLRLPHSVVTYGVINFVKNWCRCTWFLKNWIAVKNTSTASYNGTTKHLNL